MAPQAVFVTKYLAMLFHILHFRYLLAALGFGINNLETEIWVNGWAYSTACSLSASSLKHCKKQHKQDRSD